MQSSLIGKIEKANRYAQESSRVTFSNFEVSFRGEHDNHKLIYSEGKWQCTCHFFSNRGFCSHTMAMQKILAEMLPEEAFNTASVPAELGSNSA